MNIYFDCDPSFVSLEKVADKTKMFEEIQEEEEDIGEAAEELKEILKIRLFTFYLSHYNLKNNKFLNRGRAILF